MSPVSRSVIFVAAILAVPVASTMAQSNPTGNYGANRSATATSTTGDKPETGINTADVKSPHKTHRHRVRTTGGAPGGTGKTVVPGNRSTVAGDADATAGTKTTGTGGGGK